MSSPCADGVEMVPVQFTGTMVATAFCEAGDYHEDAPDTATVPQLRNHAAMHAMSCNHVVHESISQQISITPVGYI